MSVQCPCKVEFVLQDEATVLLVDSGGWLSEHPRFETSQSLFELDGIDAADAFFKPLGGAAVTITLSIEDDMEIEDARTGWLDVDVPLLNRTGSLVITSGTKVATYSPAVIGPIRASLPLPDVTLARVITIRAALPTITNL